VVAEREQSPVEAELEDLLQRLFEAPGPLYIHWEAGTDLPPAIRAGQGWADRLQVVNPRADWFEHPNYPECFIRIQNGRLAMPGAALPEEEERRVIEEVKGPMFFRAELRLTEAEKLRRTIRREAQAVRDEEPCRDKADGSINRRPRRILGWKGIRRFRSVRISIPHRFRRNADRHDDLEVDRSLQSPRKVTTLNPVILNRLATGEEPGRTVQWATFCDSVRDDCDGWADPKKKIPKWGFGDKTIHRVVKRQRGRDK
jgi:hypothetical protein